MGQAWDAPAPCRVGISGPKSSLLSSSEVAGLQLTSDFGGLLGAETTSLLVSLPAWVKMSSLIPLQHQPTRSASQAIPPGAPQNPGMSSKFLSPDLQGPHTNIPPLL